GETYIFVLDPQGNMLVHPDSSLEGKNVVDLQDINGKPIIRGLIQTATSLKDKPSGWYHYEWPVPNGLLPRWKSTYVRLVQAPSGKEYIVGAGMYNDEMERPFVVDMVKDAVGQIETNGHDAFAELHDGKGPFVVKDAYIFVFDPQGVDLVNPAFPNLEGRNLMDLKDTQGKELIREMMNVVQTKGAGWVDYMWPKPGETVSTRKSAYVSKAKMGDHWVLVGCGVYLANAPKVENAEVTLTAPQLMALVNDAAGLLHQKGAAAYPELRTKGSKWFSDNTYFIVWAMDGTRVFHAADPGMEGQNGAGIVDVHGRPYGRMFLDTVNSPAGEGWVHYMYPEPGDIFPTWKSAFVKRVTYPDGKQYLVGSGIYRMQMDRAFIEDVVHRASDVVAQEGEAGFAKLRDKTGPFVFMDTYVFLQTPDGVELVNSAQPSLENKDLSGLLDAQGKPFVKEYIAAAMQKGNAWVEYEWYKPGENTTTRKLTYVQKVQSGTATYIVGSGYYPQE
ncbi:MAG TPA: cache domain-containing protein, partial [Terracidiphilus sp.]|nr:cache domain-containing protein [Terracidiphilus sp.]